MSFFLLWLCACREGPTDHDCEDEEVEAEVSALSFEGITQLSYDGGSGLQASWEAGTGEGDLGYTAVFEALETGARVSVESEGSTAEAGNLADGQYRSWVVATDEADQSTGEAVTLTQLVSENRLVYRGEVPASENGIPGGADVWGQEEIVVLAGLHSGESFVVVDATDPAAPEVLTRVSGEGFVKDIKIGDGLMFTNGECGCSLDSEQWDAYDKIGARIFDFADPANPVLIGTIGEPSPSVHNLSYGEGVLYLTDNMTRSVAAWDISDPTSPAFLWYWVPPDGGFGGVGNVHDQAWVDGKLYVAFWTGFAVIDVSDPANPVDLVVHYYEPEPACHNVWPSENGSHVFTTDEKVGGYLRIWDISDPENVQQVANFATDLEHSVHNVHVRGDFAFVSYYLDGVIVLDVSDPAAPVEVGRYDTLEEESGQDSGDSGTWPFPSVYDGAWGVWPYGPHLAVGDMRRGLLLLDHVPEVVTQD